MSSRKAKEEPLPEEMQKEFDKFYSEIFSLIEVDEVEPIDVLVGLMKRAEPQK